MWWHPKSWIFLSLAKISSLRSTSASCWDDPEVCESLHFQAQVCASVLLILLSCCVFLCGYLNSQVCWGVFSSELSLAILETGALPFIWFIRERLRQTKLLPSPSLNPKGRQMPQLKHGQQQEFLSCLFGLVPQHCEGLLHCREQSALLKLSMHVLILLRNTLTNTFRNDN